MKTKFKIVILISGRGSNMRAIVEHLESKTLPIEMAAVISDKKSAAGLSFAQSKGIPTEVVQRRAKEQSNIEFNTNLAETVEKYQPNLVVLAGFMRVLQPEFIQRFERRIINIHPSLLPSFRGLHAQKQAYEAGVKIAGCTVHYVVPEVDAGPIIAQVAVPVFTNDSEEELSARILKAEHSIYPKVVTGIGSGLIGCKDDGSIFVDPSLQCKELDTALMNL